VEAQLAEIKKAAMAVINKFNKRDAENEEEEEAKEDDSPSNISGTRTPLLSAGSMRT